MEPYDRPKTKRTLDVLLEGVAPASNFCDKIYVCEYVNTDACPGYLRKDAQQCSNYENI
jgi:hypothetical protein